MPDNPVRITDEYPSDPVRITNLDELVKYIAENDIDIDLDDFPTNGTHVEVPARWEDLRFPAQGINPAGAASPASVDNDVNAFPGTLVFAGNQENVISGVAQLPHSWKEGTAIHPHIHWSKITADASNLAVGWELRYKVSEKGVGWSAWSAWYPATLEAGSNTVADIQNLSDFPDIDLTGKTVSCMVNWTLRRLGNTDAYNGSTRLYEIDFHYQVDTLGSTSEYVK